jgi:hypothetical protein
LNWTSNGHFADDLARDIDVFVAVLNRSGDLNVLLHSLDNNRSRHFHGDLLLDQRPRNFHLDDALNSRSRHNFTHNPFNDGPRDFHLLHPLNCLTRNLDLFVAVRHGAWYHFLNRSDTSRH